MFVLRDWPSVEVSFAVCTDLFAKCPLLMCQHCPSVEGSWSFVSWLWPWVEVSFAFLLYCMAFSWSVLWSKQLLLILSTGLRLKYSSFHQWHFICLMVLVFVWCIVCFKGHSYVPHNYLLVFQVIRNVRHIRKSQCLDQNNNKKANRRIFYCNLDWRLWPWSEEFVYPIIIYSYSRWSL